MNLPNKITTFRMVMVGVILVLLVITGVTNIANPIIASKDNWQLTLFDIIICTLFLIASFSDFLDGHLARKYNLVTNYGKFMDPIADKLLVDCVLIFHALPMSTYGFGFIGETGVPMLVVIIMISRDLIVDAIRLLAMEQQHVMAAGWSGKIKTVLQMVALTFVLLNNWPFVYFGWNVNVTNVLCYIAAIASVTSCVIYLYKNRQLFKGDK